MDTHNLRTLFLCVGLLVLADYKTKKSKYSKVYGPQGKYWELDTRLKGMILETINIMI